MKTNIKALENSLKKVRRIVERAYLGEFKNNEQILEYMFLREDRIEKQIEAFRKLRSVPTLL